MRIDKIKIYDLKIPFRRRITHALYTREYTEAIVIISHDNKGNKGYGEGTPRKFVTGETLNECLIGANELSLEIIGKEISSFDEMKYFFAALWRKKKGRLHPAAFCAVELALFDLWARKEKIPLWRLFAEIPASDVLIYSGIVPYFKNETDLLKFLNIAKEIKFKLIKVKIIDKESGLSHLQLIRQKLGKDIDIRVDANAALNVIDAISFIKEAKRYKISALEQPVAKDDLKALKKVSQSSDIPIIADESMYTSYGPSFLIENQICHGLNIRLSSCGGFQNAINIWEQARSREMLCMIGAHVGETGILSLAGRNLAATCSDIKYIEGSYSTIVLEEDLVKENVFFFSEGNAPVPTEAGLGITVEEAAIKKLLVPYATVA